MELLLNRSDLMWFRNGSTMLQIPPRSQQVRGVASHAVKHQNDNFLMTVFENIILKVNNKMSAPAAFVLVHILNTKINIF